MKDWAWAVGLWLLLRQPAVARVPSGGWTWPMLSTPTDGDPQVSNEFDAARHHGVDILYRRNGLWYVPEGSPAVAARAGVVIDARENPRGRSVVVRHRDGLMTYYQHLEVLDVAAGQAVAAGERIGDVGYDPTEATHLRHLHFEVWRGWNQPLDLEVADMRGWTRLSG